jgi:aminopeptidase N
MEEKNKITYLANYKVSNYLVEKINLTFDILDNLTLVENEAIFYRNDKSEESWDLILDWEDLELLEIFLDDEILDETEYKIENNKLIILNSKDKFTLKIITKNKPHENTQLMWLYKSNWLYCTQCESEAFRRITYYLDRPDVLTKFIVKITADKRINPILLSNWNKIDFWDLENNRHFVVWEDPFPKPCYLFALVGWNLANIEDEFITMSGKKIKLQIFTEKHNIHKTPFAMESLKKSMTWDEEKFGREYDLDIFMIVAVDDFNSGAMENKWLNIFNSQACFATEDTATDEDFKRVERVIAHEYFHNWTGDRVTCRDWFQLSLKEGLTVYRDHEFTSDLHDRAVTRIQNVKVLRNHQFREDASPMAHSIRPSSFEKISNFYTTTVYSKWAEVIWIYETILWKKGFRKWMDLYFKRHDWEAVTTEDFLNAMKDANDSKILDQMKRWYQQAWTPIVDVISNYDEDKKEYTLFFRQTCPISAETEGQKKPFLIPIKYWIFDNISKKEIKKWTFILKDYQDKIIFKKIENNPITSFLRDFSAPIKLNYAFTEEKYEFLVKHDTNEFNRFEAFQDYAKEIILNNYNCKNIWKYIIPEKFLEIFNYVLKNKKISNSFKAETLVLPSEWEIAEIIENNIDYSRIHGIRKFFEETISRTFEYEFEKLYSNLKISEKKYSIKVEVVWKRKLKNILLKYITISTWENELAYIQYKSATNMTMEIWALNSIILVDNETRIKSLQTFYNKWQDDSNVIDKWFSIQANWNSGIVFKSINRIIKDPLFDIKNPNKVRSVYSTFVNENLSNFHEKTGKWYRLISDKVIELDKLNPMMASRLAKSLINWKNLKVENSVLMKKELERINKIENLSPDLEEVVKKWLI